jgi:hypothetical protein
MFEWSAHQGVCRDDGFAVHCDDPVARKQAAALRRAACDHFANLGRRALQMQAVGGEKPGALRRSHARRKIERNFVRRAVRFSFDNEREAIAVHRSVQQRPAQPRPALHGFLRAVMHDRQDTLTALHSRCGSGE